MINHHTGDNVPYSFRTVYGFFNVPHQYCETGPTVYRPYPRRLESLTICRCYYKGSTFPQSFKDPECWSGRGLNLRPPARQSGALPTGLTGRRFFLLITKRHQTSKNVRKLNPDNIVDYIPLSFGSFVTSQQNARRYENRKKQGQEIDFAACASTVNSKL